MARRDGSWGRLAVAGLAVGLLAAGCSSGGGGSDGSSNDPFGDPGDCTVVDVAVSSEKIDLMTDLAQGFNRSDEAQIGDGCAFVRPVSKASGGATTALADGWDEASEGPRPVLWSPAASSWGQILNQRLIGQGEPTMVSSKPVSFMLTPLVIGMPKPMADALGYPQTPIGWADIAQLATSGEGWAKYGHPEWGAF
jgi:Ca-activated chloride channel family protein